jgi:hypothetical protein
MIARRSFSSPALRAAVAAVALGAVSVIWTMARALRPVDVSVSSTTSVATIDGLKRITAHTPVNIQSAVENDLFSPARTPPSTRYRMPGEDSKDEPRAEPMKPVLVGTAFATDGRSFATLQLGDAPPSLVHVGDRIGEWTVRSIARGKVVLESSQGTRAELVVTHPGN